MKNTKFLVALVLLFTPAVQLAQVKAQTNDWSWIQSSWNEEQDKPFAKLREDLNRAYNQHRLNDTVLKQYKAEAKNQPFDPQLQFRWAYAAYRIDLSQPIDGQPRSWGTAGALAKVTFYNKEKVEHSYNYNRLRFILSVMDDWGSDLIPLGQRLLKRDPKDRYVKYNLAKLLNSNIPKEKEEKLRYIREMMKAEPKDASWRALLASIYWDQWTSHPTRTNANQAIAEYQRLQNLEPIIPSFNKTAEQDIRKIQESQDRIDKRRQAKKS